MFKWPGDGFGILGEHLALFGFFDLFWAHIALSCPPIPVEIG
jgi:hypothetical protein